MTALDKLVTIMNARGQMIAASGDQIVKGSVRPEMMFTVSNNFSGKEGYIITSPVSKANRTSADGFCFEPSTTAAVEDVYKNDKVPAVVNKGELGVVLTNNNNLGSKVAVLGTFSQGSLYAVHFNPATHKAAYKQSDGQGNRARDMALFENFDYSSKMKLVMEQIANAKQDSRLPALSLSKS